VLQTLVLLITRRVTQRYRPKREPGGNSTPNAEYLRLTLGPPQGRICTQIFQFWHRLTNQMTHHQVGQPVADHSFQEKSYHALSRQEAVRWTD